MPDALLDRVVIFSNQVVKVGAAILKHMSAKVCIVPTQAADIVERLAQVPAVGDRWRRSVARSVAILALSATVARYPKADFHKITSGFPKVDKDAKKNDPQAVMAQVGP